MKIKLAIFCVCLILTACAENSKGISSVINTDEFPGFTIDENSRYKNVVLDDYEYKLANSETVSFKSCPEVEAFEESHVAEYDFFRYRLLMVSCNALKKYFSSRKFTGSFFSKDLDISLVSTFPASSIPLLNKSQLQALANQTLKTHYPNAQFMREKSGVIKIVTDDDEIYYSLMARGDFTHDGVEDLLIRSEWFARKAHGKHVDLLILSKAAKDKPVEIVWRLMQMK